MNELRLLGRRDLFGILLPGTIVIFVVAYSLFGALKWFGLPVPIALLKQQFLMSFLIFVAAYLVGSILRLYAADDVDEEASKSQMKTWWAKLNSTDKGSIFEELLPVKKNKPKSLQAVLRQELQKRVQGIQKELSRGTEVTSFPIMFDAWCWRVEEFPYPVWQYRKWIAHGLREIFDFYWNNHRDSIWSAESASPKSFFNFCKLVVIRKRGGLAEEIDIAEGLTRFFAGTALALKVAFGILFVSFVLFLSWSVFVESPIVDLGNRNGRFRFLYLVTTVVFGSALLLIYRWIVKRFRQVRLKEAGMVYNAFYLISKESLLLHKTDGGTLS
jgi:hypothetical protein